MKENKVNEIGKFVAESIDQVKAGLPDDCALQGTFNFDVSLITTEESDGKLDIKLAGIGRKSENQQVHRLRFAIVDKKSQEQNAEFAVKMIRDLVSELPEDVKQIE